MTGGLEKRMRIRFVVVMGKHRGTEITECAIPFFFGLSVPLCFIFGFIRNRAGSQVETS